MQYVEFGSLGKVSRFGMGCMRLPQTKDKEGNDVIDDEEAIKMIRHAIDNGVNYLDTAYAYPRSEEILGKALKDGYRDKVFISTKSPIWDCKSQEDYQRFFDEEIKRLDVDYIDIYLFHCIDQERWEDINKSGGIEFMEALKRKGLIKQIGFSFHGDYDLFTKIIDAYSWDMCLIQLNILDMDHQAGVRGLKYASEKNIPVVIMEPIKGGMLSNNIPERVKELIDTYKESRSLVDWAFRWLYDHREVSVILSGVSNMEQLNDNLRIFGDAQMNVMSEEDKKLINQIKDIFNDKVKVGCTGCGYCMPCPVGVNIPEIFKIYNDSALTGWNEFGKTFYELVVKHSGKDASNCHECGQCETHCPQNINIIEMLKEAHQAMI